MFGVLTCLSFQVAKKNCNWIETIHLYLFLQNELHASGLNQKMKIFYFNIYSIKNQIDISIQLSLHNSTLPN